MRKLCAALAAWVLFFACGPAFAVPDPASAILIPPMFSGSMGPFMG